MGNRASRVKQLLDYILSIKTFREPLELFTKRFFFYRKVILRRTTEKYKKISKIETIFVIQEIYV